VIIVAYALLCSGARWCSFSCTSSLAARRSGKHFVVECARFKSAQNIDPHPLTLYVPRAILSCCFQVNARHPKHGATALHLAVKSAPKSSLDSDVSDSMEECAEALLQGGADANAYVRIIS